MGQQSKHTKAEQKSLTLSRSFNAPRELVFKAWSTADHIKRWFSPVGYTAPTAEIDFRAGGVFAVCMRSPEGHENWSRGVFLEVTPPERLVFTAGVEIGGVLRFTALTTVTFAVEGEGAKMTVRQEYDFHDPDFIAAAEGAPEGWRTTLDKLEREVARIQAPDKRSVVHSQFTIERLFPASPAAVFDAFVDPVAKQRWFAGGGDYRVLTREMDVRPGGRERLKGQWGTGVVTQFDAVYFDVVKDERLVYAYEMTLDDRKISVSLATVQITPEAGGTRLKVTEQGAFLDGYDDAGSREHGTNFLMDKLGASLTA